MTQDEMDAEFGKLLRERAAVKQAIACLNSKLKSAAIAFRTAATAIDVGAEWVLPDGNENGLRVPELAQSWPEHEHTLPPLDDFAKWLRDKRAAEDRLAEIDELLPD